jgi:hypothetical protein
VLLALCTAGTAGWCSDSARFWVQLLPKGDKEVIVAAADGKRPTGRLNRPRERRRAMLPRPIVLTLLLFGGLLPRMPAAAQTGFDGVLLVRTTVNSRQDTIVQTSKGHRVRFDYLCDIVRSCTMLVDADAHTTRIIDHDRKIYLTFTREDNRRIEAMTPEMEAMLGTTSKPPGRWNLAGLHFEKTGGTAQVAGVPCEVWVGRSSADDTDEASEACIGVRGVGFAAGLLDQALAADSAAPRARPDGLPETTLGSGLLSLSLIRNGRPTTLEVVNVRPGVPDDSLFVAPAGYTEVRMADILQWLQGTVEDARRRGLDFMPRPGLALSYPLADDPRLPQPPSLASCAWRSITPSEDLGEGEVTYQVSADGVPDTASLFVARQSGTDASGYRAAAQKVVAVCRFTPLHADSSAGPILMHQRLSFGARRGSEPPDSVYLPGSSQDLEAAEIVDCDPSSSLQDVGVVRARMIIGKDGLPEIGTISAVNETTHRTVGEARIAFARCVFTPARYKGAPVRQMIEVEVTVQLRQ